VNDSVRGDHDCELCPLHRTAQHVCLMGRGAIPARVMVLGEAPGEREDDVGKPFQGRSGKLLDSLLEKAGLSRDKIYLSNAVKCRPPENRTPKQKEVKACSVYLQKEIEEVRPKFVLLLGATALKACVGKAKITELHGSPIYKDGITYFPTFHPAAALRDPKRLPMLEYDIEQFAKVLKGQALKTPEQEAKYKTVETDEDFIEMLEDIQVSKDVSFDSETTGLDRFMENGAINIVSIATDNNLWVWVLNHPKGSVSWKNKKKKQKRMFTDVAEALVTGRKPKEVYAQNGKFDNLWFTAEYGVRFRMTFDVMLAHHLIDENMPASLKFLARHYLKAPNYDIDNKTKLGKGDLPKLMLYAALDAKYTRELGIMFKRKLQEDDASYKLFRKLTMPSSRNYEIIENNGVYVDTPKMAEVKEKLEEKIEECLAKLEKHAGEEINWNSPQQINQIFFNKLKLKPRGRTPGGDPSTAESFLLQMRDDHPIIETLLEYRGAAKLHSSFIEGWENRMHNECWLHPKFKIGGTVTGRPACEDPNLQQVPRDKTIRSLIGAPDGWVNFEADYSQVELRVAAALSGEREMLRIFQTGGDIHRATASAISGVPEDEVTDEDRKKAKAVNFGFLYGMGWRKFIDYARDKYGVKLTDKQSRDFRRRFFERFSDLPGWHDRQRRVVRALGQVRTLTGRIRHLDTIYSEEKGKQAEAERQAINSPVQGFAAEMTLMAIDAIHREFDLTQVQLAGTVHDAVLGRVPKRKARIYLRRIKEIMEAPPLLEEFGIDLPVPIIVDVKMGNWGVGKKLEFSN
jgi:uracil-DNA glycosylase family 4